MHQKVLTRENLTKIGFLGPYRCCFCLQATETSTHIFVGCVFAQKVWAQFMRGLSYSLNYDPVIPFKKWQSRYPASLSIRQEWTQIWQAMPKFIWWKIWLAINDMIFNNKFSKLKIVALKAKVFLLEVVGNP